MRKGEALKIRRRSRLLSQSQLAREAGISLRALQSYEQGDRDINKASAETVLAIADALDVHPREIMNHEEEKPMKEIMTAEDIIEMGLYDQAVELMDKKIRARLHRRLAPCTELEFLDAYMEAHMRKFREIFRVV